MNNTLSYALVGLGGAAVGGGLAWYFTKEHYIKNIVEIADSMAQLQINEYKQGASETKNKHLEEENEQLREEVQTKSEGFSTKSSIGDDYRSSTPDTFDYQAAYNKKDPGELLAEHEHPQDDEEEVEETQPVEDDTPKTREEPYMIDLDSFGRERQEYSKETVYLYSDGTYAFENDEMVDDSERLFGDFTDDMAPNQTVYVRNDRMATDYEIISVESTYEETVDGIGPDWAD